jgi:dihydrofolate reductase
MAKLIYSAITSLDGYVADEDGNFDWAVPDEEVHTFMNDLERPVGAYLYGRRMYEVMICWETDHTLADQSPVMRRDGDAARRSEPRASHSSSGCVLRTNGAACGVWRTGCGSQQRCISAMVVA